MKLIVSNSYSDKGKTLNKLRKVITIGYITEGAKKLKR